MIIVENKEIIIEMSQRGPTGKRGLKGDPGTTSWNDLEDRPTLGALADHDTVNYETEIDNLPTLGALADHDTIDYNTEIDNLPTLGDLAAKDKVDYETEIDNLPTLGALADHDTIDYNTEIDNLPTLGDLAAKDKVDYENDIDNLPTLGALADHDTIDYNTEIDNLPTLGTMSEVDDAPSDSKEYARKDGEWVRVTDNAAAWGKIIGNIANQTDLNSELMRKAAVDHVHGNLNTAGEVTGGSYAITNGDRMLISDASHDNRLRSSNVIFDGSSIDKGLTQKGTFESFAVPEMLFDSEESMTATRDYVEGDLIAVGRYLYVTLSNIASGTTLVPGANVSVTTLEEQVYTKSETNDLLSAKADSADLGDLAAKDKVDWDTDIDDIPETFPPAPHNHDDRYYTESETDNLLAGKQPTLTFDNTPTADSTNPVTSGGVKTALDAKANSANVYTKAQANGLLDAKANSADVYTKTAADELLDEKLDTDADTTLTGDILTFDAPVDNAIKGLTVDIDPVQDLHGYDAPWPAGGGKNLYPNSIISGTENGFTVTQDGDKYVLSATNQTTYAQRISSETISLKAGTYTSSLFGGPDSSITFQLRSLDGLTTYTYAALGGRPHTFTLAEDTVVKPRFTSNKTGSFTYTATVQIEQGSTATSYAPYSNICPISGHTSAVVTRTGKNQGKLSADTLGDNKNLSFSYSDSGAVLTVTNNYARAKYVFPTKIGETYTVSFDVLSDGNYRRIQFGSDPDEWADGNQSYGNETPQSNVQTKITKTFTSVGNQFVIGFYVSSGVNTGSMTITNFQLEHSSSASSYEPYSGTSLTIDLDGTRYGGQLNVLTGELRVTHAIWTMSNTVTGKDWTYQNASGHERFGCTYLNNVIKKPNTSSELTDIICTSYKTITAGQTYAHSAGIGVGIDSNGVVWVYDPAYTEVSTFKTAIANEQIVYPLATPITVQLSPATLSLLLGENNIWSDTGPSTAVIRTGAGRFAYQDSIDYDSDYLTNKPDLAQKADIIKSSASGSLVHLTDAGAYPVDSLSVAIEPVQDLHGYDAPWPAGGNVNLLSAPDSYDTTTSGIRLKYDGNGKYSISGTNTSSETTSFYIDISSVTLPSSDIYIHLRNSYSTSDISLWLMYDSTQIAGITFSSENRISKLSALSGVTVNKLIITVPANYAITGTITFQPSFELGSTATSWTPYSNICHISGHTSAVVTRTGRNLCYDPTSGLFPPGDGQAIDSRQTKTAYARVQKNTSLVFSCNASSLERSSAYGFASQPAVGVIAHALTTQTAGSTITFNSGNYEWVGVYHTTSTGTSPSDIQIEVGTIPSAYEPYSGTSLTIDLDGTRYGGTLNVLTGEMRVDRKIVDLGDLSWNINSDNFYSTQITDFAFVSSAGQMMFGDFICSNYMDGKGSFSSYPSACALYYNTGYSGYRFFIHDVMAVGKTTQQFKTYVDGAEICYLLATPLTVQLTPSQLTTLFGENNLWSDTGDTEITYRADTKLYIDQKIAASALATRSLITAVTTAMVAPKNLVANDLLIVNDDLIKITANVNNGGTLTLGTNCSKLTLAEYILSVIS